METAFIFIPDTLDLSNNGFLIGLSKHFRKNLSFFITSDELTSQASQIIGVCSVTPPNNDIIHKEWIHINNVTGNITIQNITEATPNVTCVSYNLEEFKKCENSSFKLQNYGMHFETLYDAVHNPSRKQKRTENTFVILFLDLILAAFCKLNFFFKYSSTAVHFESNIGTVKTMFKLIEKDGKLSLKVYNIIISKILDILLGLIALYYILKYERQVFIYTNKAIESVIHNLRDLLDYLMGSPIGLKLNHAFNMTLGTFFFYHISLWKIFIQFTRPLLHTALYFLIFPAVLGFSFQVAIFEDLIKFCSFHVYCIYVYAARLYGLQIHVLISLWRLFIGRKYNPLRRRVDSYQYNHHQLFIGTLGFTILLFLLPTTLLYYIVFTVFRLGLKLLNFILVSLRVLLQQLPLYVVVLWMLKSPSIAGMVILKADPPGRYQSIRLSVSLKALPLWTSIKTLNSDLGPSLPEVTFSKIFYAVFVGTLL